MLDTIETPPTRVLSGPTNKSRTFCFLLTNLRVEEKGNGNNGVSDE